MSDLEFMVQAMYRHVGGYTFESRWPNLFFEPSGMSRLASIAGWLTGLEHAGQSAFAEVAAVDICDELTRLNNYGGSVSPDTVLSGLPSYLVRGHEEEWKAEVERRPGSVPQFRVVLADDGTFGGFSLLWYRALTYTEVAAKQQDDEPLDVCLNRLKVRKCLEKYMMIRRPESLRNAGDDSSKFDYVFFVYTFGFNGGLIMHGPKTAETIAAYKVGDRHDLWSVHT